MRKTTGRDGQTSTSQSHRGQENIIMIIIIAFKGAIRDFLQPPHCAANCLQHIRSGGHSELKLDRVEIAFILALFYWLNY